MKKLALFLCTGMVIASLTACGGNEAGNGQNSSEAGNSATGSSAAGSTADSSAVGSTTENSSGENLDHNYAEGWTEEMEGIKAAVTEALGDDYFPNMPLEPDMLEGLFGITADMYDDYFAELPMISTNVDALVIIKAKDDKAEEVEGALNAYRNAQVSNTMQYPQNVGKVQASIVERIGNYVCYVQLGGDVMDALESGDEAVILHCKEANDLVLDIIGQKVQQ